jgi:hypothetical protein
MKLLNKAYKEFIKLFPEKGSGKAVSDNFGIFCYSFDDCVLVAKAYTWQGTVSCHERIWKHCLDKNKYLVMFIESPLGFYKFNVGEIKDFYENERRGVKMINFKIDLGEKYHFELSTAPSLQSQKKLL